MSETEGLEILVFAMPFIVVALALFVVWLTGRLNAWEDRRRPPRIVHLDSTVG